MIFISKILISKKIWNKIFEKKYELFLNFKKNLYPDF